MNGSGIQMSDTVENTVGNAQNQVKPWAFKNWNFINLVKEGFFAKPLLMKSNRFPAIYFSNVLNVYFDVMKSK